MTMVVVGGVTFVVHVTMVVVGGVKCVVHVIMVVAGVTFVVHGTMVVVGVMFHVCGACDYGCCWWAHVCGDYACW